MRYRTTSIVLTVAITAALLGGCVPAARAPAQAGEAASSVTPTATPTHVEPVRTGAVAPVPPADLDRTDEIGATAAAEHFLRLWGYTMQTGDVGPWDAMSDEACRFCRWTRGLALSVSEADDTFTGGDIRPVSTYLHPFDDVAGGWPVDVDFVQDPSERHSATGRLLAADPPDIGTLGVDVIRLADGWKVMAVTAQDGAQPPPQPSG